MHLKFYILFIFFCLISVLGCREESPVEIPAPEYSYEIPENIGDGWQTTSLQDAGLNAEIISGMMSSLLERQNHNLHSVLIAKNGKLVLEEYFRGYKYDPENIQGLGDLIEFGIDTLHYFANGTKSITSLLFGIGINEGNEVNLNDFLYAYYPEYSTLFSNNKRSITIQHLLNMSAGLDWFEYVFDTDEASDFIKMQKETDPKRYILGKNLIDTPGSRFNYNSGYTILLQDILTKKTGNELLAFAESKLFDPLQINDYKWEKLDNGMRDGASGLYLSPRSMAKIGHLYASGGRWGNIQVVPREWIELTANSKIDISIYNFSNSFGLHWWRYTFETFSGNYECLFAAGRGEQYIYSFPGLNMVVVFTGGYYFEYVDISTHLLIRDYIVSAIDFD